MNEAIQKLRSDMDRLRGRLFGAVEATGMPAKQENAIKGLIRTISYDAQASCEAALRGLTENGNVTEAPAQVPRTRRRT